jgi:hypothetical protein
MKKLFLFLMVFVVTASLLGLRTTRAQAADWITYEESAFVYGKGIVYIFSAAGHRTRDVKGASIYVGSDLYNLFCWVTTDKQHIVCNAQGGLTQFAGQTAIIYLAGQMFYVTIPHRGSPPEATPTQEETPLVCPEGQVSGADVLFVGDSFPVFIQGSTLEEVQSSAESWEVEFEIVSELYCQWKPV